MSEPIQIIWQQARIGDLPLNKWWAQMVSPGRSLHFAAVERVNGSWRLTVWSGVASPSRRQRIIELRYASPCTAKRHVERWAALNWRRL